MTENFRPTILRTQAREALRCNWGSAALATLIFFVIICAISGVAWIGVLPKYVAAMQAQDAMGMLTSLGAYCRVATPLTLFVGLFIGLGMMFLFLDVARGGAVKTDTLFEGFKKYGRYLIGMIIVAVLTWLWTLLLVIPGIVKYYAYSMTFYIMRDNPELSPNEARKESMRLMRGHKMELFLLELSFIGWGLLTMLTLGVGMLWLYPYIYTSCGRFYETLKAQA